jgi:uncharacterized protein (TIGR02118 family)
MVKLTFCLRRLPHLTREEFQRYWRDTHGPLVRAAAHALEHPLNVSLRGGRGAPEPYDGVAELWWDSVEDLAAAGATPEGREAGRRLLEDERRFIDLARSPLWVSEEHVVV